MTPARRIFKKMPVVGITMGDPAGIGPEIILKALADKEIYKHCIPLIVGGERAFQNLRLPVPFQIINDLPARFHPNVFYLLNQVKLTRFPTGQVSKEAGRAAVKAIELAVQMALAGRIQALVTAPLSKESMHLAGFNYPGHTELLKKMTRSREVCMVFGGGSVLVGLLTTHLPVKEVSQSITFSLINKKVKLIVQEFKKYVSRRIPRIGLCALNPHAGEGGIFGDEENNIIRPAVSHLKAQGISIEGPIPADTIFRTEWMNKFDLILALYHDQGMIPVKMMFGGRTVNMTWGLPFPRTSPDHGTAFDIAGKNKADPRSMAAAIKAAIEMSFCQNNPKGS